MQPTWPVEPSRFLAEESMRGEVKLHDATDLLFTLLVYCSPGKNAQLTEAENKVIYCSLQHSPAGD